MLPLRRSSCTPTLHCLCYQLYPLLQSHDGNKDANSSVESGNATLCDMAVGGRASREIPLEFTNNSVGLPKKEIMVGIMAVNKLGG